MQLVILIIFTNSCPVAVVSAKKFDFDRFRTSCILRVRLWYINISIHQVDQPDTLVDWLHALNRLILSKSGGRENQCIESSTCSMLFIK